MIFNVLLLVLFICLFLLLATITFLSWKEDSTVAALVFLLMILNGLFILISWEKVFGPVSFST